MKEVIKMGVWECAPPVRSPPAPCPKLPLLQSQEAREQGQNRDNDFWSAIYKTIKDKSYSYTPERLTRKKKVERFTGIIFAHSDINDPGNFVDFLEKNKNKTKNLNGIRSAITKSYGETDGLKYYSLFKPYFKIISALK